MSKGFLVTAGVLVGAPIAWALLSYGTVAPCQMAAKEAARQIVRETAAESNPLATMAAGAMATAGERTAEAQVSERGLLWCAQTVFVLKTGGRERAYLATMQSDLRNLITAEGAYYQDNGAYTTSLRPSWYTVSGGVTAPIITVTADGFTASVGHNLTTKTCAVYVGTTTLAPATRKGEPACW